MAGASTIRENYHRRADSDCMSLHGFTGGQVAGSGCEAMNVKPTTGGGGHASIWSQDATKVMGEVPRASCATDPSGAHPLVGKRAFGGVAFTSDDRDVHGLIRPDNRDEWAMSIFLHGTIHPIRGAVLASSSTFRVRPPQPDGQRFSASELLRRSSA